MSTLSDHVPQIRFGSSLQSYRYPASGLHRNPSDGQSSGCNEIQKNIVAAHQQELAAAVAAAREQGFREAEAAANATAAEAIQKERAAIATALSRFEREQAEYFRNVEHEAVRLALSIARKVVQREVQMDPLLLSGIVRVALDQIQAGSRVVLRTPPGSLSAWQKFCVQDLDGRLTVEVLADAKLKDGCILQSEAGTTEISVEGQLEEIERGFFDRLQFVSSGAR